VAGLIKATLAVQHGLIPPSLNFRQPNPKIPFDNGPFRVNDTLSSWPESKKPRRAGVSSFGIGGTNVHMILEEAPATQPSEPAKALAARSNFRPHSLGVGASYRSIGGTSGGKSGSETSPISLHLAARQKNFRAPPHGRMSRSFRRGGTLRERTPSQVFSAVGPSQRRRVAFLLPGLGDQYVDMGRGCMSLSQSSRNRWTIAVSFFSAHGR